MHTVDTSYHQRNELPYDQEQNNKRKQESGCMVVIVYGSGQNPNTWCKRYVSLCDFHVPVHGYYYRMVDQQLRDQVLAYLFEQQ